mmetsp:Transcript_1718/g.3693  ORF Transcript_1718/g.3693 Transcript_1718/m.3693 type:complete len:299 (-) Transcript_1718:371-1267(-)
MISLCAVAFVGVLEGEVGLSALHFGAKGHHFLVFLRVEVQHVIRLVPLRHRLVVTLTLQKSLGVNVVTFFLKLFQRLLVGEFGRSLPLPCGSVPRATAGTAVPRRRSGGGAAGGAGEGADGGTRWLYPQLLHVQQRDEMSFVSRVVLRGDGGIVAETPAYSVVVQVVSLGSKPFRRLRVREEGLFALFWLHRFLVNSSVPRDDSGRGPATILCRPEHTVAILYALFPHFPLFRQCRIHGEAVVPLDLPHALPVFFPLEMSLVVICVLVRNGLIVTRAPQFFPLHVVPVILVALEGLLP